MVVCAGSKFASSQAHRCKDLVWKLHGSIRPADGGAVCVEVFRVTKC